jgi:flagellar protein FlaG
MSNIITSTASVGDHPQGSPHKDSEDRGKPPPPPPSATPELDPADLRLVIEGGETLGSFVYKTIDARTGQVVRQMPREELLGLGERADYHAGDVINARA